MRPEDALTTLHRAADLAAARGSLILHLDLATELAKAAFAAQGVAFAKLATLADEQGYRTIALDDAAGALAEARFDDRGDVVVLAAERLPPRAGALAEARAVIAAEGFGGAAAHAAIVVPADDPHRPIEGYAIAVADDPDTVKADGHWLLTLDATGRHITARTPLPVTTGDAPATVRALRDAILVVAEAVPGEIHTYLSLKHGAPLIVHTAGSGLRWRVDGERTALFATTGA